MERINLGKTKLVATDASGSEQGRDSCTLKLHPAEMKLIQVIRSIEFGEIEGLKVENGLPVYYKGARKTCKLA